MDEKQSKSSFLGRFLRSLFSLAFFAVVAFFIFNNVHNIKDYFYNINYTPSSDISQLADRIELTDNSRRVFYATLPSIDDADEFNNSCTSGHEQTAVLGCYVNDRIYIYNVTNQELDGIKETTAAHELLHAEWARLSSEDRENLKQQLNQEYERIKTPALESLMSQYEVSEPGEHENELHSILATEFNDLSPELEQYYARYFKDRKKVVAYYESYNSKFEELENQSAIIASQMAALKEEIDSGSDAYRQDLNSLNADIVAFNQNARSGYYTDESDFYYDRQALQTRIDSINQQYTDINSKIDTYNQLRTQLEEISVRTNELNESINSTLTAPAEL